MLTQVFLQRYVHIFENQKGKKSIDILYVMKDGIINITQNDISSDIQYITVSDVR